MTSLTFTAGGMPKKEVHSERENSPCKSFWRLKFQRKKLGNFETYLINL